MLTQRFVSWNVFHRTFLAPVSLEPIAVLYFHLRSTPIFSLQIKFIKLGNALMNETANSGRNFGVAERVDALNPAILTSLNLPKKFIYGSDGNSRARVNKVVRSGDSIFYLGGLKPTTIEILLNKGSGVKLVVFDD